MNIHIYEIICYLLICNINDDDISDLLKSNIKNIVMNSIFYLEDASLTGADGPVSPLGPGGPRGPCGP
jgi:hypothetical protein